MKSSCIEYVLTADDKSVIEQCRFKYEVNTLFITLLHEFIMIIIITFFVKIHKSELQIYFYEGTM